MTNLAATLPGTQPLTDRWTPLRKHTEQFRYLFSPHRFNTVVAGRRSGKTEILKRRVVMAALWGTRFPDPRFFLAAPVRDQAKRIFWNDAKLLVPNHLKRFISESELKITLINNSEIHIVGLDKPERIEGSPWDGGGITEFANVKAEAWGANIRPALSDRGGWCDLEGVPEGRNHYYHADRRARERMTEQGTHSPWGAFHWVSEDILSPEEIADAKEDLDEQTYAQEFEASFINFEGRAYYCFTEAIHCRRLPYDPNKTLILCLDFNVDPGVAVICQEMMLPNGLEGTGVVGEVFIERNSNTPAVIMRFADDWKDHAGPIHVYGDATGGARKSSQTDGTDWDLVRASLSTRFSPSKISYRYPRGNPSERSRVNAVNSRLRSISGQVRMMVDPSRAPHVQMDLEGVLLLKGGSGQIDKAHHKDDGLTHLSDSIGYYTSEVFPVVTKAATNLDLRKILG